MKNKMRVAFLLPSLKFGGAERVSLNLAKELQSQGLEVDFLLMSKQGEFLAEAELHFNVHDLKCNRTYKLPYKLLCYLFRNRPHALICSFWKLNLCSCLVRVFYPWAKLILWEHSPPSKSNKSPLWLYVLSASLFYQLSTKVVAVSIGVREDIKGCTFGISRKVMTIYNAIAPPAPTLKRRAVPDIRKRPQLISVGRLEREKNPQLLLEAFALIAPNSNADLLFVGDGSLRVVLEQRCVELKIEDRVIFSGFSFNPYEFLVDSDVFVLSSDFEGMSNVIVEALFCGLPIVSTDCPTGPRELLVNGKYGSLVPIRNVTALASAIEFELDNGRLPDTQKAAAQRFLPSLIATQFIDIIV